MYLPLALLIVLGSLGFCGASRFLLRPRRRRIAVYAVAAAVLVAVWTPRTFVRNLLFTKPDAVWRNVIAQSPDNGRAYHNLGYCLYAAGNVNGALPCFRRAIALKPNFPEAYTGVALVLLEKGDLPGAVAVLRQGIAAAPRSEMLYGDLGFVLDCQGKTDEAAAQYRLALKCNPGYGRSHYHLGRLLQRRGDWEEAAVHLQAANEINPLDARCSFWLALAYQRCGRFPQAIRQYRRTLELVPALELARRNLERCRAGSREGEMPPDELKTYKASLPRPGTTPRSGPVKR